jgi:hypothetical protein
MARRDHLAPLFPSVGAFIQRGLILELRKASQFLLPFARRKPDSLYFVARFPSGGNVRTTLQSNMENLDSPVVARAPSRSSELIVSAAGGPRTASLITRLRTDR